MPSAVDGEELEQDVDDIWRVAGTVARDTWADEELGAGAESGKEPVVEGTSDSGSAFSRRRALGGGTSEFSNGRGGPFINAATVFDAESYVRRLSSPSLRRLPLLEELIDVEPLPLLPLGAESRRLV